MQRINVGAAQQAGVNPSLMGPCHFARACNRSYAMRTAFFLACLAFAFYGPRAICAAIIHLAN